MAYLFVFGMLIYYILFLRSAKKKDAKLALLLWRLYFLLGLSATIIEGTGAIEPIFQSNYISVFILLSAILINISGFLSFRMGVVGKNFFSAGNVNIIENFLIISQVLAILFFLPFAISALSGDANANRLELPSTMARLASFGFLNTIAGAASQLFTFSIALAFLRIIREEEGRRNLFRVVMLWLASLSYVIYILAYVGRDGVIYWIMNFILIYVLFSESLDKKSKKLIVAAFSLSAFIVGTPFMVITVARFFDAQQGGALSFFEYFGAQIINFSDYSSIDRPLTYGLQNFPMFANAGCVALDLSCNSWIDVKDSIFDDYLQQGKVPWVFGTFVSDFVADFGTAGMLMIMCLFALICTRVGKINTNNGRTSLGRFFLILFLFLVPYWGVFYFRFGIINGFIIVNLLFVLVVSLANRWPRFRIGSVV